KDAQRINHPEKALVTIIERVRMADRMPVVYCLDKLPAEDLTCAQYQNSDESLLNAIEYYASKKVAYAETEIEAIGYEPHISDILDASSHEGLMLLKLIHYDINDQPIIYSFNYFKYSLYIF